MSATSDDFDMSTLQVIFNVGEMTACATQNVSITQDFDPEGTESFLASLRVDIFSYIAGIPSLVTVFIDDDDDGKLIAQITLYSIHI